MMLLQFANPDDVSDDRFDESCRLGLKAWLLFKTTMGGRIALGRLSSDTVRDRAEELFMLGFTARTTVFKPYGEPKLDELVDEPLVEIVWEDYLLSVGGQVVLDGVAYPDTPKEILVFAWNFFRLGFKAGTIVYNGLMKD